MNLAFKTRIAFNVGALGCANFITRIVMMIAKIASKNVSNLFVFINIPLYFLIYIIRLKILEDENALENNQNEVKKN